LAKQYRLVIQPAADGGFTGATAEMPLIFGEGDTIESCARDVLEATAMTIAFALALGEKSPSPASESKREMQVNIRLNSDEKMQIEERARLAGFRSISDYMRVSALRPAS
jgi:predicted RNase H-like HicB family nuclease